MRRWGPVLVLVGSLAGCAHADYGQLADSATTAVALSRAGFAEGNPLLSGLDWPEIAAAKLVITQAVKLTPEPICEPGLMGLTVFGYLESAPSDYAACSRQSASSDFSASVRASSRVSDS